MKSPSLTPFVKNVLYGLRSTPHAKSILRYKKKNKNVSDILRTLPLSLLQKEVNIIITPITPYHAIRPPSDDLQNKSKIPQNIKNKFNSFY